MRYRTEILYQQNWLESRSIHDFCYFYHCVKQDFKLDKYLVDLDYPLRQALCKFRSRSNSLPVCNIRFANDSEKEIQSIYDLCRVNEVGDEYHYLFVCPFFDDERKIYLSAVPSNPDVFFIRDLFNPEDVKQLINLSKFVRLIMTIFEHSEDNNL